MMDKNAKIFVAGGSGMVGSAILRKLLEKVITILFLTIIEKSQA